MEKEDDRTTYFTTTIELLSRCWVFYTFCLASGRTKKQGELIRLSRQGTQQQTWIAYGNSTWHASKYKVHKVHRGYIPASCKFQRSTCDKAWESTVSGCRNLALKTKREREREREREKRGCPAYFYRKSWRRYERSNHTYWHTDFANPNQSFLAWSFSNEAMRRRGHFRLCGQSARA